MTSSTSCLARRSLRASLRAACLTLAVPALLAACAPAPGVEEPGPLLRAVVISDINDAYGSTGYSRAVTRIVERITGEWRPDLVLAAGDLIAGQATALPDSVVRAMWSAFDETVAAPLRHAGIALVATPGNHDASAYPAHARDRRLAEEYWLGAPRTLVEPLDDTGFPFRYTVRVGSVFIAVWDATTQESSRSGELLDWLRRSLESPEARAARHRIVLTHLPLYAVAEGRDRAGELLADGDHLRRLLEGWGATLMISGHHHAYYPGRRGTLELLHAGALGGGPRPLLGDEAPPRRTVTMLGFHMDSIAVTTYEVAPDGSLSPLVPDELPEMICSRDGWVLRRDVRVAENRCTPGGAAY